jgi:hypothetical protein
MERHIMSSKAAPATRSRPGRAGSVRTCAAAFLALAGLLVVSTVTAGPAAAAPSLSASPTANLSADGTTVTVTGSGYDEEKGIYVALCVDNGPGRKPTPCIGGVDTSGSSGSSIWITNKTPGYAEGLTKKFGKNGSFNVRLSVKASDGNADCRVTACVIATRADHRYPQDTSQLARVPVTFGDPKPTKKPTKKPARKPTQKPTKTPSAKPSAEPTKATRATPPAKPSPQQTGTTRPTASPEPSVTETSAAAVTASPTPTAVAAAPTSAPASPPATETPVAAAADVDAVPVSTESDDSATPWVLGGVLIALGVGVAAYVAARLRRTSSAG